MQQELTAANVNVQILGMNQLGHEGGNSTISQDNTIPWLQDGDTDNDGQSDVWLNSWAFTFRDVVIVGPNNEVLDIFNVTTQNLAEGENFNQLKDLFVQAAATLNTGQDSFVTLPNTSVDLNVLSNDDTQGSLDSVTQPANGSTEVVSLEYPADLMPAIDTPRELLISEVLPGQFIEFYNVTYEPVALDDSELNLLVGGQVVDISQAGAGTTIPARGYMTLPLAAGLPVSDSAGELLLYRGEAPFTDPGGVEDYLVWGTRNATDLADLVDRAGEWSGSAAGAIANNASIQRLPSFDGRDATGYDSQHAATPDAAFDNQTTTQQVVRYEPTTDYAGDDSFSYTIATPGQDDRQIDVQVTVVADAAIWQNPTDQLDINNDGHIALLDALLVINALNAGLRGSLPASVRAPLFNPPYLDCNGNGSIEPLDALLIINHLNAHAQQGSAEGESTVAGFLPVESRPEAAAEIDQNADSLPSLVQIAVSTAVSPSIPVASPQSVDQAFSTPQVDESPVDDKWWQAIP